MKKLFVFTCAIFFSTISIAQAGWNWPEDEALKNQAVEKQAYYKVLMAQSNYQGAMEPLNWLYNNNQALNPSIYIDGFKCLKEMMKGVEDEERKTQIADSMLWMFDQRIEHFDNDAKTKDRKAYEAFRLHYRNTSKYGLLADLYEEAYALNGVDVADYNHSKYMMLASQYYKSDPSAMPPEKVLDIHTQISSVIDEQIKNGGNKDRLQGEQSKVDGFLGSVGDILNCEFIESTLVPKFRNDPSDISTAKKIFRYSVQAKCSDKDFFLEASETVFADQPSFALASAIGSKYLASEEYDKAIKYHDEAFKLAESSEDKADALMGKAIASSKKGQKVNARKFAYEALSEKPGNPNAYNLIGNMYFTSFQECQGGKSKVIDRGVYLAAYKMYERAGNKAQMQASKEQFPSIEEIFSESYEEGQNVTVGCWINETVTIQRR